MQKHRVNKQEGRQSKFKRKQKVEREANGKIHGLKAPWAVEAGEAQVPRARAKQINPVSWKPSPSSSHKAPFAKSDMHAAFLGRFFYGQSWDKTIF